MLRGLLEDISKGESVYASPRKRVKTTGSLRAPGAPVKPKPLPYLLKLPTEVRNRIYDYLIPDTTITLHYHRMINGDPSHPIGYTSPPSSAGHVYQRFRIRAVERYDGYQWDEYSVLANGAYGITLAHRLLRAESLVRVLQSATFQCNDAQAAALVFTRCFPALWRPHLQFFAGWIAMRGGRWTPKAAPTNQWNALTGSGLGAVHPDLPTDPGCFPKLRKVQLNCPAPMFEDEPHTYFDLEDFKAASKKELLKEMLKPVWRVAMWEGDVDVVNAFMLVSTLHSLEWVVRRKCFVAVSHETEGGVHVFGPNRKCEYGWFMLEYHSKTGKLTRKLKGKSLKTTYHKGGMPDEEVRKRWTLAEEIV